MAKYYSGLHRGDRIAPPNEFIFYGKGHWVIVNATDQNIRYSTNGTDWYVLPPISGGQVNAIENVEDDNGAVTQNNHDVFVSNVNKVTLFDCSKLQVEVIDNRFNNSSTTNEDKGAVTVYEIPKNAFMGMDRRDRGTIY